MSVQGRIPKHTPGKVVPEKRKRAVAAPADGKASRRENPSQEKAKGGKGAGSHQKAGRDTLRCQERQVHALDLRRGGASYAAIGRALGVAEGSAWKLVQKALMTTLQEPAEAVRGLELNRLDHWLAKLQERIDEGDDRAITTALKITEQRAKLLGLYAPVVVQSPDGAPVRFVVEVPIQASTLADWQAQAARVIDVKPADLSTLAQEESHE